MKGKQAWSSFTPLLLLFIALRLMMMATFPADNLTLYGDYPYYYKLALYSSQGLLPFLDYWSEYPPVFPFLSVGIYQLSRLFGGTYHAFVYLMGLVMLGFDTGNLLLLLRLARRLRGEATAERLGWVYSILFIPLIYTWWGFDTITTFFLLLALETLLSGQEWASAAAAAVGTLVKAMPLLILPLVVRTRPQRRWLLYGSVVVAMIGAALLPLIAAGGSVALASLRFPLARPSWETVWALLDGNLTTGLLGSPADHFDLGKALAPDGNPARVPEWIRLGAFGLLYLFLFRKADLKGRPRRQVAFLALTLVVFFLWSKGWSPQWQLFLFPLLLLALPLRRSVLFILALSFVNLAEWPVLLSRGMHQGLYLTVPLRTLLFVLLLIDLAGRTGAGPKGRQERAGGVGEG